MSRKLCKLSQGLVRHRCMSFQWAMYTLAKGGKHKAPLMDSIKDRAQSGEKNTAVYHQWCMKTSQGISPKLHTYSRFQISSIITMIKDRECQPTESHRGGQWGSNPLLLFVSSFLPTFSPNPRKREYEGGKGQEE